MRLGAAASVADFLAAILSNKQKLLYLKFQNRIDLNSSNKCR